MIILVSLLLATGTLLLLGRESNNTFPSANNPKPSGFAVFAEVLRRQGYEVNIELNSRARISQDAVLVVCELENNFSYDYIEDEFRNPAVEQTISKHEEAQGAFVSFYLPNDFDAASRNASPINEVTLIGNPPRKYQVTDYDAYGDGLVTNYPLAVNSGHSVLAYKDTHYTNPYIYIDNGIAATNRFIRQADNAQYLLDIFESQFSKDKLIVFYEPSWGHEVNPTIFESIGGWAVAAWWQLLILIGIVIFTLNRRFGTIIEDHVKERGMSDVLLAMSHLLKRSKKHDQAVFILLDQAYERIRKATRASPSTSPADLARLVPPDLQKVIHEIRTSYGVQKPSAEWIRMARTLEIELQNFENETKSRTARSISV